MDGRLEEAMAFADHSGPSSAAFQSLIQLSSSIIPLVVLRLEFWFMLGVHLMTWGAYQSGCFQQTGYVASAVSVDWIDLKILTLLSIFFLAFHVNQCFQRYLQLCASVKRLFASVHDFAGEARLFFATKSSAPYHHLATRWLSGCTLLTMDELQHGTLNDELWRKYVDQHLVRRSEVEFLRSLPMRPRLLAMSHMAADLSKSQLKEEEFLEMLQRIVSYKELHQEVIDLANLQLPIQYKHLLSVTVFLNLLFLAYGMALSDSLMAPCIFLVLDLAFLGMLDVAQQLWNPFRSRTLDFAVEDWKEDFRSGLRTILNYQHQGATQQWKQELEEEQQLNPNLLANPQHVERLLEGKPAQSPQVEQMMPAMPETFEGKPAIPAPSPQSEYVVPPQDVLDGKRNVVPPDAKGEQLKKPLISPEYSPVGSPPQSPSMPPLETLQ